jgi:hypothetical protein
MSVTEFTAKQLIEHWVVVFICSLQLHLARNPIVNTGKLGREVRRGGAVDTDGLIKAYGTIYGTLWKLSQSGWPRKTVLGIVIALLHFLLGFGFQLIYAPNLYHLAVTVFAFVFLIVATKAEPLAQAPVPVWWMIIVLYTLMLITAYMAILISDSDLSTWIRRDPDFHWTNIRYLLGDTFLLLSILSLRDIFIEKSSGDSKPTKTPEDGAENGSADAADEAQSEGAADGGGTDAADGIATLLKRALTRAGMIMIPHITQLFLLIAATLNMNCTGAVYLAILLAYPLCQLAGKPNCSPWLLCLLFSQMCVGGLLLDATTTVW